jgi:hypothetical protein
MSAHQKESVNQLGHSRWLPIDSLALKSELVCALGQKNESTYYCIEKHKTKQNKANIA